MVFNHSSFLALLLMNFLAHYYAATRLQAAVTPLPAYTVGTALPDLLPLAAPRTRLRLPLLGQYSVTTADSALTVGVLSHLNADTAFHKSPAFAEAQVQASRLLKQTEFVGIRVRRFFVAHILVELALDAALLRSDPALGEEFYAAFGAADFGGIARWTENAVSRPLPELPHVLERFADARYLLHYHSNDGVAEGLSHLCARARQDGFTGENFTRLSHVVGETVSSLYPKVAALLSEAAHPPTTSK